MLLHTHACVMSRLWKLVRECSQEQVVEALKLHCHFKLAVVTQLGLGRESHPRECTLVHATDTDISSRLHSPLHLPCRQLPSSLPWIEPPRSAVLPSEKRDRSETSFFLSSSNTHFPEQSLFKASAYRPYMLLKPAGRDLGILNT